MLIHEMFSTTRLIIRNAAPRTAPMLSTMTTPLSAAQRAYTSTADYSKPDVLSKTDYEKQLDESHAYLRSILEEDDADAPWNQSPITIHNRSVQNMDNNQASAE
ncbi:hypothetical protein H4219_005072 [Mycoemilia scoparia]|uniref:Uncharacterized protein n=1 Tax=Mycoemilia scoparia TaxID=417184 RepID=A0A9W7ZPB5_9FUNG|nr:hypothetical protein H4219_005072 [Mycoemilia scoparia]